MLRPQSTLLQFSLITQSSHFHERKNLTYCNYEFVKGKVKYGIGFDFWSLTGVKAAAKETKDFNTELCAPHI